MVRFDEVELEAVPLGIEEELPTSPPPTPARVRRFLALLADLSLFAALALALSPLLPDPYGPAHVAALGGFVLVMSYYYFVGAWMLWGKTIGSAIFDVRVPASSLREASVRWVVIALIAIGLAIAVAYF